MSHWLIYWITRLDSIESVLSVTLGVLIVAVLILGTIMCMIEYDNDEIPAFIKKVFKVSLIIIAITVPLCIFIPSTKEICAIYLIPKVVNNEEVKKIPDNLLKLLNAKCEAWINDQLEDKKTK